jgi:hypothetical protein
MEEKFKHGNGNYEKQSSRNVRNEKSINQMQTMVGSIISRQDQIEERILEMEESIKKLLHTNNHKVKYMITIYKNSRTQLKDQT